VDVSMDGWMDGGKCARSFQGICERGGGLKGNAGSVEERVVVVV
jgi:hypothetical protein